MLVGPVVTGSPIVVVYTVQVGALTSAAVIDSRAKSLVAAATVVIVVDVVGSEIVQVAGGTDWA
ncbi:hypothetical protein CH063_11382 [Colletotrichum higginsianum]|uniref:Uncharacterized protein n=1 Tax=Colletotrichum higginsianum (strain IMI 349063) TaxID=759273 RepID=H1VL55_COLHI|nr:hypothetical protein CH063_11382 [Colletotrichum higginsianum]